MPRLSTSNPTSTPVTPVADVALDDWCESKSRSLGRRVEALSAFYRRCQKLGIGRATAEKYEADFQAFLKLPA
jgi:hypothetical protein